MKKIFKIISLYTILFSFEAKSQVGISEGVFIPAASAILDVNYTNKGVLIPQYDLLSLNNTTTPIVNPVDGLIIYNKGGASTHSKGVYIWINNQWRKVIISGSEPQTMSLVVNSTESNKTLLVSTNNTTNNPVNGFTVVSNKITSSSLGSDNSTITLPAGTYLLKYGVDTVNDESSGSGSNTQYFGQTTTCTKSYLVNSSNATISNVNRECKTSNIFATYSGTFFLTLTAPTSIRQRFEFDNTGNNNGLTNNPLKIRSNFVLVITKMTQ